MIKFCLCVFVELSSLLDRSLEHPVSNEHMPLARLRQKTQQHLYSNLMILRVVNFKERQRQRKRKEQFTSRIKDRLLHESYWRWLHAKMALKKSRHSFWNIGLKITKILLLFNNILLHFPPPGFSSEEVG